MKEMGRKAPIFAAAALALLGSFCVAVRIPKGTGGKAAAVAAGFILPAGNTDEFFRQEEEDGTGIPEPPSSVPQSAPTSSVSQKVSSRVSPSSAPSASSKSSSVVLNNKVLEVSAANGGTQVGNFWVKNATEKHKSVDFAKELTQATGIKIAKDSKAPQVLIYHTHTTESYDCTARTTDLTKTVCAVGDKIAEQLETAGIGVVHDKTVHDYPAYDGSYDRSLATMQKNLKQYPSIKVTLDIHRDAMHRDDGTMLKTTAVVGGKKAAQVMILSGCDDDGTLGFPNWEYNLRLALRIQNQLAKDAPGLARPLDFCARRYNENVTKGSLLIEIGTDANTLDEAKYSGTLVGQSLAKVLQGLT
ncbi:MAG: Stage II sporulation protein P [Thermocaproicibacter melissae]|jgi:stage II sporulation protein P|uniref:stage II sporulation protein P n=1 Tax=Thermocaproicibacter melissae TaxID=2966552 RepID=UPI003A0FF7F2